jgi:hypothetical protein
MNFFEFNGKKYTSGTIVKLNNNFVKYNIDKDNIIAKAFVGNDQRYWFHIIGEINQEINKEYLIGVSHNEVEVAIENIIEPNEFEVNNVEEVQEKYCDWEYNGLITGWIIYVFLMAMFSIFKGAIGFWIITSVVFFNWRSNKLKPYGKNK